MGNSKTWLDITQYLVMLHSLHLLNGTMVRAAMKYNVNFN